MCQTTHVKVATIPIGKAFLYRLSLQVEDGKYMVSRPKGSILSVERNYVKQFHALHTVKTMNHSSSFNSREGLMQDEICLIFGRKNAVKIWVLKHHD
jgi:hypothetical protein